MITKEITKEEKELVAAVYKIASYCEKRYLENNFEDTACKGCIFNENEEWETFYENCMLAKNCYPYERTNIKYLAMED